MYFTHRHSISRSLKIYLILSNRLKNIEETERAKKAVAEERKEYGVRKYNDEEHLAATRCVCQLFFHFGLI